MIRVLEELLRITVYGSGGLGIGYALCLWVNDQHRLTSAILNESETDMPARRRFLSPATLQSGVVILVMVALLLSGIAWLSAERENAEQDRRDCLTLSQIADTLQGRTQNYREAAIAERELWRNIRRLLSQGNPDSPAADSIDQYLREQGTYLRHLRDNPYPRDIPEDC